MANSTTGNPSVGSVLSLLNPATWISLLYQFIQILIAYFFAPLPPTPGSLDRPLAKVAVIGSGITGVSTASHLVGHGIDVTIFEAGPEEQLGGIWANVNSTSGLQISSIMYRWFPAVRWTTGYPKRDEILSNVYRIWHTYGLDKKTRFNTPVKSVERHSSSTDPAKGGHGRWIINGNHDEIFDAVVVSVGTCGKPKMIEIEGSDKFNGKVVHSSQLDGLDLEGKRVVILGGGASGVEALELAVEKKAKSVVIGARSDKWLIPRNTVIDAALACQPFGRETYLSWIPELLLRKLFYRDLEEKMAPTHGFYTGTPIVNSTAMEHIRKGKADYVRGDTVGIDATGVTLNTRKRGQKKGDKGVHKHFDADIIVVATGFERPSHDFLPKDLFPTDTFGTAYEAPNLYVQVFSVMDWSIVMPNATFKDAVGTVGHYHIGIMARILALFLIEERCRPVPSDMRLWVDLIRFIKAKAPGGALTFMTYVEMNFWLFSVLLLRLSRLPFAFFVAGGWGYWTRAPGKDAKPRFHLSMSKLLPSAHKIRATRGIGGPLPVKLFEKRK